MSYLNRHEKKRSDQNLGGSSESKFAHSPSRRVALPDYSNVKDLFPIPSPPQLEKVSEPKPVKRIAPGYDMRTLRKQLDQLHQDILDRVENQGLLYRQNETLWTYMMDLLDCNKTNAVKIQDHVETLHDELHALHRERVELAEKLQKGQALKSGLDEVRAEYANVEKSLRRADEKQLSAYKALDTAHQQNEQLEISLQNQVERMHSVHSQLDELRLLKREEDALELADEHYRSCRSTLRSALSRFRDNMRDRLRLRSIYNCIDGVYRSWLLTMTMGLWQEHHHRMRIAKRNRTRRLGEILHITWARWKVHTALERHFRACVKRRQLKAAFGYLREGVRMSILEHRASEFRQSQILKDCMRVAFRGWSSQCMFLLWDSHITKQKEATAIVHRISRLFIHWRQAAADQRCEMAEQAVVATEIAGGSRRVFSAWKTLFHCIRIHRERSLLKVFTKMNRLVTERDRSEKTVRKAVALSWRIRQRSCLRRLLRRVRRRQKISNTTKGGVIMYSTEGFEDGTEEEEEDTYSRGYCARINEDDSKKRGLPFRVGGMGKGIHTTSVSQQRRTVIICYPAGTRRKKIFTSLLTWVHRIAKWKRQELSFRLASIHHTKTARSQSLRIWFKNTVEAKRTLEAQNFSLKRIMFDQWCVYVPREKRARRVEELSEEKYEAVMSDRKRLALRKWHGRALHSRRLKIMEYQTLRRVRIHLLCAHYSKWRSRWGSSMLWKEKESRLEAKRSMALVDLRTKELEDLAREKAVLLDNVQDASSALERMTEAVSRKDIEIAEHAEALQKRESDILAMQEELKVAKERLEDVISERNRLRVLEEVFDRDREFENARQRATKAEAEKTLRQLEEETFELRREVEDAKKLTESTIHNHEEELLRDEKYLESTVAAASTLHTMVQEKTHEVEELQQERDDFLAAIASVKNALQSTTSEVLNEESDRERELRKMRIEVDAMRSTALETESRVEAIRDAVRERQDRVRMKQLTESSRQHFREVNEMSSIAAQIHSIPHRQSTVPENPSPSALLRPNVYTTSPDDKCHDTSTQPSDHNKQDHCDTNRGARGYSGDEHDAASLFSGDISSVRSMYMPSSPVPVRSESPLHIDGYSSDTHRKQFFSSSGNARGSTRQRGDLHHVGSRLYHSTEELGRNRSRSGGGGVLNRERFGDLNDRRGGASASPRSGSISRVRRQHHNTSSTAARVRDIMWAPSSGEEST